MRSPAHRAAVGFLQGALVVVVAQVVATPVAAAMSAVSWLAGVSPAVRAIIPIAGFALGGAVGGESLEVGQRGALGFACGGIAAGLVLTLASPHLSGLTGFEAPTIVVAYAVAAFAAAFGTFGCLGATIVRRGAAVRATVIFAAAGAVGGVLGVLPFLVAHAGRSGASGPVFDVLFLVSSVGSVAFPFAAGGSLTARALTPE